MSTNHKKTVSLLELFFDLIFVYAVSRMTGILEQTENGMIRPEAFGIYLLIALVVLQGWLYQTNYNNRFYHGKWYENIVMSINMMAALFLSGLFGREGTEMLRGFDLAMMVLLSGVGALYYIHAKTGKEGNSEAISFAGMILLFLLLYAVSLVITFLSLPLLAAYICMAAAVLLGAFLPMFVRRDFDTGIVDFHHLTERFELLIIVTFGEMVTAAAGYFKPENISFFSFGLFMCILLLFGCYVMHNHNLIDRSSKTRGLILMYSHFAMVIALDLITVVQIFSRERGMNERFLAVLISLALCVYFGGMFACSVYCKGKIWSGKEKAVLILIIVIGNAVLQMFCNHAGRFAGVLLISGGMFIVLYRKAKMLRSEPEF